MLLNALPINLLQRLVILVFATVLVNGCSTIEVSDTDIELAPPGVAEQAWQKRQDALTAIRNWRATGRVAVSNGDEAWNLNMEWQQKGDDYQIILNGPFGAGKVQLVGNAEGVLMKDSDEQTFYADTPETLLYEQTGLYMPVSGLRYWIIGLTAPGQNETPRLDKSGRLAYIENEIWQVKYKRYTQVSGIDLPRKVFIVKGNRELDVRLVVDSWKLGAF